MADEYLTPFRMLFFTGYFLLLIKSSQFGTDELGATLCANRGCS